MNIIAIANQKGGTAKTTTVATVAVQPGGFELHALVHLDMTVRAIQDRVNPNLTVLGTVLTNCHRRRAITARVSEEISRVHNVLGSIRADARLLYATTAGTLLQLKRSNALDDYAAVAQRLQTIIPWPQNNSAA